MRRWLVALACAVVSLTAACNSCNPCNQPNPCSPGGPCPPCPPCPCPSPPCVSPCPAHPSLPPPSPCPPSPPPVGCTVGAPCAAQLLAIYNTATSLGWTDVACLAAHCCTHHGPIPGCLPDGCASYPCHRQKIQNAYDNIHGLNGQTPSRSYCFSELNHWYP